MKADGAVVGASVALAASVWSNTGAGVGAGPCLRAAGSFDVGGDSGAGAGAEPASVVAVACWLFVLWSWGATSASVAVAGGVVASWIKLLTDVNLSRIYENYHDRAKC